MSNQCSRLPVRFTASITSRCAIASVTCCGVRPGGSCVLWSSSIIRETGRQLRRPLEEDGGQKWRLRKLISVRAEAMACYDNVLKATPIDQHVTNAEFNS